ncbi:heat-shock protein, partial [Trifolium medium]|nr:heat-shock protein [Trifolium medium]
MDKCQALLHNFLLQAQSPDLWQWQPDPVRGYSVRRAYQLLTSQQHDPLDAVEDLIWHKQ